jgi:hypothetical protein
MLRGAGPGAGRCRRVQVWRWRAHCGASIERTDTGARTEAHRKGARPGTATAMPAVLCEGPSRGVGKVEGVGRRVRRAAGVNGLAQMEPCAQWIPRATRSVHQILRAVRPLYMLGGTECPGSHSKLLTVTSYSGSSIDPATVRLCSNCSGSLDNKRSLFPTKRSTNKPDTTILSPFFSLQENRCSVELTLLLHEES